jgi:hypothetical protein
MITLVIIILIAVTSAANAETASPFISEGKPPPGFEALLEPQRSLVDVYFGGRFLVSTMATFDLETITFRTPEAMLEHLPELRDPVRILNQLRSPLPINADRRCLRPGDENCGSLTPDVAGVIFDADRFKADVFVSPQLLVPEAPDVATHLPRSDASFSFLQNFNIAYSGSSAESDSFNLSAISTVAYRENRIAGVFSYTDEDELTVDTLAFQRDRNGREIIGGLFRTRGRALSFITERDVYGVRYATSVNTRTDLALSRGIPLEVFLPLRARVDIFKDGRLINSEFLEAGNRLLDTRRLPDGAYDVTLRIRDSGGVREDVRFFVKAARLPPINERFFQFVAGRILDRRTQNAFPSDTGHWMLRGGVTQRLSKYLGVETGLAASDDEAIVEFGLFVQGRFYEVQGEAYASTDQNRGGALTTRVRLGSFAMTGDVRKTVRKHDDRFSLTHEDLSQQTITIQYPMGGGTINFSARRNRRTNESTETQSVAYRRPLFRAGRRSVDLDLDITREDEQWLALIGVQVQLARGNWNSELTPQFRYDELSGAEKAGHQFNGRVAWYDPAFRYGDLRVTLRGNTNQFQDSVGSELDFDNRFGQTRIEVNRVHFNGRELTSYVGAFNSSFLATADSVAFGGQYRAQSAVVLNLEGQAPGTTFDVLVDGARRGYAPADSRTAIHLRPFESYAIGIRPRGGAFVDYDSRVEWVTLYPGNIVSLSWEIAEQIVIVGRIIDSTGQPLVDALIKDSVTRTTTDEFGMFQLELNKPEDDVVLNVRAGEVRCRIRFPVTNVREGVAIVGNVVCRQNQ